MTIVIIQASIFLGRETVYVWARFVEDGKRLGWEYLAKRGGIFLPHDPEPGDDNVIRKLNNSGTVYSNTHQASLPPATISDK